MNYSNNISQWPLCLVAFVLVALSSLLIWCHRQTTETAVGCFICGAMMVVTGVAMRALDLALVLS